MAHLLLLVGGWAGAAGRASAPSPFDEPHALALILTLVCLLALWLLGEESRRQLRAQAEARVVPFPGPTQNGRRS